MRSYDSLVLKSSWYKFIFVIFRKMFTEINCEHFLCFSLVSLFPDVNEIHSGNLCQLSSVIVCCSAIFELSRRCPSYYDWSACSLAVLKVEFLRDSRPFPSFLRSCHCVILLVPMFADCSYDICRKSTNKQWRWWRTFRLRRLFTNNSAVAYQGILCSFMVSA